MSEAARLPRARAARSCARSPRFRRVTPPPFALMARDVDILATVGRLGVVQSRQLDLLYGARAVQNLRRRLYTLYHAGYLDRPKSQRRHPLLEPGGAALSYVITRKGAELVREATRRVVRPPAPDLSRGSLRHALEVSAFLIGLERAVRTRGHLRVLELHELRREERPAGKRAGTWRVDLLWQGKKHVLRPAPDRIFGLQDRNRPDGANRRLCFLEIDRGTMPVIRPTLEQTSIVRKFVAYSHTYEEHLEERLFGVSNFRTLFVGTTPARIESMLRGFAELKAQLATPKLFLFTDWRTIHATGDLLEVPWRRPDGAAVRLLD